MNFFFSFQASDFTNIGDWPTLGENIMPEQKKSSTLTNHSTNEKASVGIVDANKVKENSVEKKVLNEKIIEKNVEAKQSSKINSAPQNIKDNEDDYRESNGVTNGLNRKVSKQKWVPLQIDLSKGRSKRGGLSQRRRITDYDENDWRSGERPPRERRETRRPTRGSASSSYRGRGRGGGGERSTRNNRRPQALKSVNNDALSSKSNNSDYADYQNDFGVINKLGADGSGFMMPYLGTYYCNGSQSFVGVNSMGVKDCIKKQM